MLGSGISRSEQEEIVRVHNEFRARIANGQERRGKPGPQPPAADMEQMVRRGDFGGKLSFFGGTQLSATGSTTTTAAAAATTIDSGTATRKETSCFYSFYIRRKGKKFGDSNNCSKSSTATPSSF